MSEDAPNYRQQAETMVEPVLPLIKGILVKHWAAALEEMRARYDAAHSELVQANNDLAHCRRIGNDLKQANAKLRGQRDDLVDLLRMVAPEHEHKVDEILGGKE